MFDKLGDLLSDALEKGELPKSELSKSGNDSQNEKIESTFSDFDFMRRNKTESSQKIKPEPAPSPKAKQKKLPESVKTAFSFINIPEDADFNMAKKIYREKLMYYHPDRRNDNPVLQKVAKEKTARLLKEWETVEKWFENN